MDVSGFDRIHLGYGNKIVAHWLNVDRQPMRQRERNQGLAPFFLRLDLAQPLPLPKDHFCLAYSEDFIEHLNQGQSVLFLAEVYRILQPGGVFRLSTPGLIGAMQRHVGKLHTFYWDVYQRWKHQHLYTQSSLAEVCELVGFRDPLWCKYGTGPNPELLLDTRPNQADLNLVVELHKQL